MLGDMEAFTNGHIQDRLQAHYTTRAKLAYEATTADLIARLETVEAEVRSGSATSSSPGRTDAEAWCWPPCSSAATRSIRRRCQRREYGGAHGALPGAEKVFRRRRSAMRASSASTAWRPGGAIGRTQLREDSRASPVGTVDRLDDVPTADFGGFGVCRHADASARCETGAPDRQPSWIREARREGLDCRGAICSA